MFRYSFSYQLVYGSVPGVKKPNGDVLNVVDNMALCKIKDWCDSQQSGDDHVAPKTFHFIQANLRLLRAFGLHSG